MSDQEETEEKTGTDLEIQVLQGHWRGCQKFLHNLLGLGQLELDPRVQAEVKVIMNELYDYVRRYKESQPMPELEKVKTEDEEQEDKKSPSTNKEKSSVSGDSDSDASVKIKKTGRSKKKVTTTEKDDVISILSKLDNRKVLDMEEFEEDGHMELSEYLDMFEEYHKENYKGRKYFWLNQLKKYLTGRTLESYKSIRQNEDSYNVVKEKLIKWYEDEEETRKQRARKKFENVKMKEKETLLSYSNRLLSAFKKAFPNKKPEFSGTLIYKLQKTVPKSVRKKLDSQIAHYKLRDMKMSWEKIQKYCGILDLEDSGDETTDRDEGIVKINLTRPNVSNMWNDKNRHKGNDNTGGNGDQSYVNKRYQKRDQPTTNRENFQYNKTQANKFWKDMPKEENYDSCSYCGRFGHGFDKCRKRLGGCFICGKYGHFAKDCYSNKNAERKPNGRKQSVSPSKNRPKREYERSRSHNVENRRPKFEKPLN